MSVIIGLHKTLPTGLVSLAKGISFVVYGYGCVALSRIQFVCFLKHALIHFRERANLVVGK